jgi:hypothetical protein
MVGPDHRDVIQVLTASVFPASCSPPVGGTVAPRAWRHGGRRAAYLRDHDIAQWVHSFSTPVRRSACAHVRAYLEGLQRLRLLILLCLEGLQWPWLLPLCVDFCEVQQRREPVPNTAVVRVRNIFARMANLFRLVRSHFLYY